MTVTIASDPEAEFKALVELMKDSAPTKDEDEEEGETESEIVWFYYFNTRIITPIHLLAPSIALNQIKHENSR